MKNNIKINKKKKERDREVVLLLDKFSTMWVLVLGFNTGHRTQDTGHRTRLSDVSA